MRNEKIVSVDECAAVAEAAKRYAEGLRIGSVEEIRRAFHPDALMYGFSAGKSLGVGHELLGGSVENLYDLVDEYGASPEIRTRIDVLAMTPTTAVVRIDMENDTFGILYNDFLNFIKLDGRWQAVAKVFHQFTS